jgi:hypothetical protein
MNSHWGSELRFLWAKILRGRPGITQQIPAVRGWSYPWA